MKKTLNIEDKLLKDARLASGAATDTEAVRLGLEARHAAYNRLRALRGREPSAATVPRRRQTRSRLMVLVDTSVWIHFLANRAPYAAGLERLLALDEVAGHELVYGELLIGDRGGRTALLAAYEKINQASTVPHSDVVEFSRTRRLYGRGAGWIGIHLLASAVAERLQLWTADLRFSTLAGELQVSYRIS